MSTETETGPEVKQLWDQGGPKSREKLVPQPKKAGVCEEYHRAQPALGLKRFYVRALNAECHVGRYVLAEDAKAAEGLYLGSILDHLPMVGFVRDEKTGAWRKPHENGKTSDDVKLRIEPLTD